MIIESHKTLIVKRHGMTSCYKTSIVEKMHKIPITCSEIIIHSINNCNNYSNVIKMYFVSTYTLLLMIYDA